MANVSKLTRAQLKRAATNLHMSHSDLEAVRDALREALRDGYKLGNFNVWKRSNPKKKRRTTAGRSNPKRKTTARTKSNPKKKRAAKPKGLPIGRRVKVFAKRLKNGKVEIYGR